MREYDMPIEEQVKSMAKELRALSDAVREGFAIVNEGFANVDKRFDAVDQRFDGVDERLDAVDKRFDGVDQRLDAVDKRLGVVDKRLDTLQMLGEETNAIAKLGLERVQGLRESMDAKFAGAAKHNAEQTELLKATLVHVRKRVERVEKPKRRRA